MPNTLQRNLNLCFTKIKPEEEEHNHHSHRRRRRQPPKPHHPGTLTNTTKSILIKNFNSLYDPYQVPSSGVISGENKVLSPDHDETAATPDFATVYASQRFFFSSPGRSNSIIESSSSSSLASTSSSSPPENEAVVGGGVAIPTFSPDPYMDFRRSMQEMVEARDLIDVRANWDYLHELLMCYLTLNPKSTHKFIVGAFADLLVSLMTAPANGSGGHRNS